MTEPSTTTNLFAAALDAVPPIHADTYSGRQPRAITWEPLKAGQVRRYGPTVYEYRVTFHLAKVQTPKRLWGEVPYSLKLDAPHHVTGRRWRACSLLEFIRGEPAIADPNEVDPDTGKNVAEWWQERLERVEEESPGVWILSTYQEYLG